jgi:ABC-type branched-subunit amino acid transport system substrate-binding protein
MIRRRTTITAFLATGALLLAACGGDDEATTTTEAATEQTDAASPTTAASEATEPTAAPETTAATEETAAPETTEAMAEGWMVNTDDCIDPDAANAPIEGTVQIASAMPLSGGVAAAAFAPVKDGFEAYIKYANDNGLLEGYSLEVAIEDDQYNAELTPGAVATQIEAGAHLFAGIIGTPNNLAVRDTLNDECIPQLNALTGSPAWGEVADYPWTTGLLVPYTVESQVYAAQIAQDFPDGATASLFYVNNEFGQVYAEAFKAAAEEFGIEILGEQTIEPTDSNPPTSQVTTIAGEAPDVIMAVPLGAGCISFLTEVANAKAQNAGWAPATYITNTCASSLILGAAGAAADGLFTSNNLVDVTDPANAEVPVVAEYLAFMEAEGKAEIAATAVAGWTTGEITVAILAQAAASPEGLTRASIINAARNFEDTPTLAREGVVDRMNGEEDPFLAESLQVVQYKVGVDGAPGTFTNIGELITSFES